MHTATIRDCGPRCSVNDAAAAYKAYFLRLGKAKLKNLLRDESTGIALQAAWETYLKPAKRKERRSSRTNDVYDAVELGKFVNFFKERTAAPVPDWWASAVTDVDLFPRRQHAFVRPVGFFLMKPEGTGAGGTKVKFKKVSQSFVCTDAGRSVVFSKDTFESIFAESFVGWLDAARSVVAAYDRDSGFGYLVAGFEGSGGNPAWKVDVASGCRH